MSSFDCNRNRLKLLVRMTAFYEELIITQWVFVVADMQRLLCAQRPLGCEKKVNKNAITNHYKGTFFHSKSY